jgi:uncharacterized protein (DUF849 family)
MATPRAILLKACLNGGRQRHEHPAVPVSAEQLARDAREAVAAGAGQLHVHPRGPDGKETLGAEATEAALTAIRGACPGTPVGVTTGLWAAGGDVDQRLRAVTAWAVRPDFASVNFSEPGALDLCAALLDRGIGVEAGVWTVADADAVVSWPRWAELLRVLVEPQERNPGQAVATAAAVEDRLIAAGVHLSQLHHGYGIATWAVLAAAVQRGHDVRVGLEDTTELPDGRRARDNRQLVEEAVRLIGARRPVAAAPGGVAR